MPIVPRALLNEAAQRFKLLSEPVRLELLNHLHATGEMPVQALVEATGHNQANVSKHLLLMARAGLLHRRQEGLYVYYSIKDPTIQSLCLLVCSRLQQEETTEG
ncbi:MAG TPA: metalloregulator ArsR/SmtB family transcription factor [Rhodothermales bacterium]|nr:metalloregulator ArsR/SmtB family transcription factor [Rhodothermales bacterium]